jgi:hypothetical protein
MAYTDYSAVHARNPKDLSDLVVAAINDGWQPLGVPTTAADGSFVQALIKGTPPSNGGGSGSVSSADITDATAVGISVLTAVDAAAARTAIGAGTSDLELGSSGTTAAAGNHDHDGVYAPASHTHESTDITDATAVGISVLTAADAATARAAIGAGTSDLVIGTTSDTAKAGDYTPPDATTSTRGLVLMGAAVADATDEGDVVTQFNALLASLRAAGSLATSE